MSEIRTLLEENMAAQKMVAAWPLMEGQWVPGVEGGRLVYEDHLAEDLELFMSAWASVSGLPCYTVRRNAAMLLASGVCRRDFTVHETAVEVLRDGDRESGAHEG